MWRISRDPARGLQTQGPTRGLAGNISEQSEVSMRE